MAASTVILAFSRIFVLAMMMIAVLVTEIVTHRRDVIIPLVVSGMLLSVVLGAVGAYGPLTRGMVKRFGFISLEWLQFFELLCVSGLCTAITVLSGLDTHNETVAEAVSVAMALNTGLLLRIDLGITVRVAGQLYEERLRLAVEEYTRMTTTAGSGTNEPIAESDGSDESDEPDDITPPTVSKVSLVAVHCLAIIVLPAPLIGAFVRANIAGQRPLQGHLWGMVMCSWVRVMHSFIVSWEQLRNIQTSTDEDDEMKDLEMAEVRDPAFIRKQSQHMLAMHRAGVASLEASPTNLQRTQQLQLQQQQQNPSQSVLVRTESRRASNGHAQGPQSTSLMTSTRPAASGLDARSHSLTMLTTQSFRNNALSIRDKRTISEFVHAKKPSYKRGMVIGRGGFSTVYACLNNDTGELMACKAISFPADDDHTDDHMDMLQNEVAMMRQLDHPHVVKYLFCDKPEPSNEDLVEFYIMMEYVGGGSVRDIVKNFGSLSERAAAAFTVQMLLGLEYLHGSGRVHRDVKPGNMLCRSDGHIKLSDFGTAADLSGVNEDGESDYRNTNMAGTPMYSAPEVTRGELQLRGSDGMAHAVAADMWSVGCTVMEMVTAKHPWYHFSKNALKSLNILMNQFRVWRRLKARNQNTLSDADLTPEELEEFCLAPVDAVTGQRNFATPTLPPNLSPQLVSFLEACLQFDPMRRWNATALLGHPWIQQFDLLDLDAAFFDNFGGPIDTTAPFAESTERPPMDLGEGTVHLQSMHIDTDVGGGGSPATQPLPTPGVTTAAPAATDDCLTRATALRPATVRAAMGNEQSQFVRARESSVKLKMNRFVVKTRALMRLGAFKAKAADPTDAADS